MPPDFDQLLVICGKTAVNTELVKRQRQSRHAQSPAGLRRIILSKEIAEWKNRIEKYAGKGYTLTDFFLQPELDVGEALTELKGKFELEFGTEPTLEMQRSPMFWVRGAPLF